MYFFGKLHVSSTRATFRVMSALKKSVTPHAVALYSLVKLIGHCNQTLYSEKEMFCDILEAKRWRYQLRLITIMAPF